MSVNQKSQTNLHFMCKFLFFFDFAPARLYNGIINFKKRALWQKNEFLKTVLL